MLNKTEKQFINLIVDLFFINNMKNYWSFGVYNDKYENTPTDGAWSLNFLPAGELTLED